MRVLLWHVHGSWTTAFVQGRHEYLLPKLPEGGAWGGGRSGRDWPVSVRDVPVDRLADEPVDVAVLQRPEEEELLRRWLGRRVPIVYLEHNTPKGDVPNTRHPVAGRKDLTLVHVTHFNELMYDNGGTPTAVIEHGIPDPGYRYTGEVEAAAVVVNEPVRRGRVTGTDLFTTFAGAAPLHLFGMGTEAVPDHERITPFGDLPTEEMHDELARRRLYLHTPRWTSLGLSLLEAMHLGMPVVALGTTEAARAVPEDAGVVSTRVDDLVAATRRLIRDPGFARDMGKRAREHALARYGLDAFLAAWDDVLARARATHGGHA